MKLVPLNVLKELPRMPTLLALIVLKILSKDFNKCENRHDDGPRVSLN